MALKDFVSFKLEFLYTRTRQNCLKEILHKIEIYMNTVIILIKAAPRELMICCLAAIRAASASWGRWRASAIAARGNHYMRRPRNRHERQRRRADSPSNL